MMWYRRQQKPVDYANFSETNKYTASELEQYATALLKSDRKESGESHNILFEEQLYNKSKREIMVDASDIDGTLTNVMQSKDKPGVFKGDSQRMYNRAHPQGRRVNTDEARKNGSSYYAN